MLKYNFDYKLTYRDNFNENCTEKEEDIESNTKYRKDIINVFNMQDDYLNDDMFFKIMSNKVNDIYKELKKYRHIEQILSKLKETISLPFELEDDMIFIYLFRFDLFFIFHECLKDYNIYGEIRVLNYDKVLTAIKS